MSEAKWRRTTAFQDACPNSKGDRSWYVFVLGSTECDLVKVWGRTRKEAIARAAAVAELFNTQGL